MTGPITQSSIHTHAAFTYFILHQFLLIEECPSHKPLSHHLETMRDGLLIEDFDVDAFPVCISPLAAAIGGCHQRGIVSLKLTTRHQLWYRETCLNQHSAGLGRG